MLLGGLVLHERVTIVQVLASGLIIAGIMIAYRALPATPPSGPARGPAGAGPL
jgi:drug/metabolite transporter (DMT)-like permease